MNLNELLQQINSVPVGLENGDRYQKLFGELVQRERSQVVVETGVHRGVSTAFILDAMQSSNVVNWDENGQMTPALHSCDPDPIVELEHPLWRLWKMTSRDALPDIYRVSGPWDIFLHDSDHGSECQTFEYELAWNCVRNGGIIATDDPVWGTHGAWEKFCARHNATTQKLSGIRNGIEVFGSVEYIRKAGDAITPGQLDETVRMCVEMGRQVAGLY